MPLETPNLAPVLPGQPITSQAWNEIVTSLAEIIGVLNAQAGQSLRVTVNNPSADPADMRVSAIAEGPQGAVFEAARPVPPDTAFTLTGLPPGNYTIRAEAPGFEVATVLTALPGSGTAELTMTRSAPAMPDVFGLPLNQALSALATAGVVVQRVLDITGRDIAPANPGAEFLESEVLVHLPRAGEPAPASSGAQLVIAAALEVQPTIVMPSLAGLTLSETRKVLEDLGLVLGNVSTRTSPTRSG
jgi:hypothetical protein